MTGDSPPRMTRGVTARELADHVRGHYVVASVLVVAAFLHGDLTAKLGRHLQRLGVADARQPDLDAAGVEHDLGAVGVPAAAQLRLAVGDGDELDALPAAVGQPGRQWDGAGLNDLVDG